MAAPTGDAFEDEVAEIYAANPGLREELDEMERQLDRGELELVDHAEMRRRYELVKARHER